MGKTIRFGELVRNSGRPQFVTLWTAPEKDERVSRAMKEHRVLTVLEEPGQKPHGLLGLHPGPHSLFLLFPRPLQMDAQTRVVGMNYALAEQPEVKDPVVAPEPLKTNPLRPARHRPSPEAKSEPPPPPKPVMKTFSIRLKRTATLEETRQIDAENRADAERQALEAARADGFNLSKATVREEIVR
jgi:hypothetical protein